MELRARDVRYFSKSGRGSERDERPFRADIVAKVFLRGGTRILRPVGAAIEQ
jgi:hypothetical protein